MILTQILQKIKSGFYTKSEVDTKLNSKANDSDVVHKRGDETISGNKVFTGSIRTVKSSDEAQLIAQNEQSGVIYLYANKLTKGLYAVDQDGTGYNILCVTNDDGVLLRADHVYSGPNYIDCSIDSQGAGWIRYSSGLQICWGWKLTPVTFPKAFKDQPHVTLTHRTTSGVHVNVTVSNVSASSFEFIGWYTEGNTLASASTEYIAIGKWK